MKNVTLIVHITARIPDDADTSDLALNNRPSDFVVAFASKPYNLPGATVAGFATVDVLTDDE